MIPRFSLRTALLVLPVGAVLAVAVFEAIRGRPWGFGVVAALGGLAVILLVQAMVYCVVRALSPAAPDPAAAPPGEGDPS